MLGAVMFAHDECKKVDRARSSSSPRRPPRIRGSCAERPTRSAIKAKLKTLIGDDIAAAYKLTDKSAAPERAQRRPRQGARTAFADADAADPTMARAIKLVKKLEAEIVRGAILKDGSRIDGRDTTTRSARSRRWSASCRAPTARRCSPAARPRRSARPRSAPRTAEQMIDGLTASPTSASCCTTTSRLIRSAKWAASAPRARRDVGHGKLAWRALQPGAADQGGVPLHDPRPLRHHRVQRLVVDGDGVRRLRWR